MELVTNEEVFNSLFINKEITFESLFVTALNNNFIGHNEVINYKELYEDSVIKYIMQNNIINEDVNINFLIKKETAKIMRAIDEYLKSLMPYNALNLLVNSDPIVFINQAVKVYEEKQNELKTRIFNMKKNMQKLCGTSFDIENILNYLETAINKKIPAPLYKLLGGEEIETPKSLKELERLYDVIEMEFNILSKFNVSELRKILNCDNPILDSKNLVEACLYNYIFNYFYKEDESLGLTLEMAGIISRDIQLGLFEDKDVIDIIETGSIDFSDDEKSYIFKHFLKTFDEDVVKLKRIDCFIQN